MKIGRRGFLRGALSSLMALVTGPLPVKPVSIGTEISAAVSVPAKSQTYAALIDTSYGVHTRLPIDIISVLYQEERTSVYCTLISPYDNSVHIKACMRHNDNLTANLVNRLCRERSYTSFLLVLGERSALVHGRVVEIEFIWDRGSLSLCSDLLLTIVIETLHKLDMRGTIYRDGLYVDSKLLEGKNVS